MEFETQIITCKNNQKTVVQKKLRKFIQVWETIFDEDEEIIDFEADPNLLKIIDLFYQLHNYEKEQILTPEKIESNELEKIIDGQSIEFLKMQGYKQNEWTTEYLQEWIQFIQPLLTECYRLNCEELIEIINISIAVFFYIEGFSEKDFKEFSLRWQIQYPLPPLQQRKIVEENKFVFERQQKKTL